MSPDSVKSPAATLRLQPIEVALRERGIDVFYTTWLRWIRTKELPALKIGGRFYVDLAKLDEWIAAQGVAAITTPPAQSNAPRTMSRARASAVLSARRAGRNPR